jgi:hypothetical protein
MFRPFSISSSNPKETQGYYGMQNLQESKLLIGKAAKPLLPQQNHGWGRLVFLLAKIFS